MTPKGKRRIGETDQACGHQWVENQAGQSLTGETPRHKADNPVFIARSWATSSTAC